MHKNMPPLLWISIRVVTLTSCPSWENNSYSANKPIHLCNMKMNSSWWKGLDLIQWSKETIKIMVTSYTFDGDWWEFNYDRTDSPGRKPQRDHSSQWKEKLFNQEQKLIDTCDTFHNPLRRWANKFPHYY